MKADQILAKYAQGERNFSGLNLNGLCFKGKTLTGANFSNSSLKGTNFSYANLQGCQFHDVKIGIRSSHLIVLIMLCCGLLAMVGFGLFVVTISQLYLFSATNFTAILLGLCLLIADCFLFLIFPFHLIKNNCLSLLTIPLILGLTGIIIGAFIGKITLPVSLSLALIGGITGVIIGLLIIVIVTVLGLISSVLSIWASLLFLLIPLFTNFLIANFFAFAQILNFAVSLTIIMISCLLGVLALKNNLRSAFLLKLPHLLTAYLGTRFYYANLTNAEFNQSWVKMKNIDLRQAHL